MREALMRYGGCISGSTGRRRGATKRDCGFVDTMSTTCETNHLNDDNQAGPMMDRVVNLSCDSVVVRAKLSCLVIAEACLYSITLHKYNLAMLFFLPWVLMQHTSFDH